MLQDSRSAYAARMHRVLEHVDQHLDQPLSLDRLAAVAYFSPFHFHRLFTAWMGETLGDYLRRRRLARDGLPSRAAPRSLCWAPGRRAGISLGGEIWWDNNAGCLRCFAQGDRRSIGRADEVAPVVLRRPGYLPELAAGLWHPEPLVRMRAGDALEKVSRRRPEWLRPIGQDLLALAATTAERELQRHLAQLLPRVGLGVRQRKALVPVLRRYSQAPSAIVRVSALQALVELMGTDRKLRPLVRRQLRRALTGGSPAERARARRLLAAGAA